MKRIVLLLVVLSLFASFAYAQQEPVVFQEVNVNASIKDAVWLFDGEYVAVVMDDSQNTLNLYDKNSNFITNLGVVGDEGVSQRKYNPNYMLYDERNSLLYWWVRNDDGSGSDFIIKQADLSNIGSLVVSDFKKGDYNSPSGTRYYFTTLMDDTYFYYNKRVNTGPMVTYRARRDNNTDVTPMTGDALVTEYNYWRLSDGLYYSTNTKSPYQTYSVEIDGTQITRTLITSLWVMDTFNRDINDLRSLSSPGNKIKFGDPLNPSPVPTVLGCGNFTAITYPSDDFIFGIDEVTGRYAYCDFSNELNPHVFTYVGFNATAPANRYYNDWSDIGAYEYWGSYTDYIYINNVLNDTVQMVVIDGSASETVGNSPPLITHKFLGVDDDRENFVFALSMSDVDGGQLLYAQDVDVTGVNGGDNRSFTTDFNSFDDLFHVSNDYCPGTVNFTYDNPFSGVLPDGVLRINTSNDCFYFTRYFDVSFPGSTTDKYDVRSRIGWKLTPPTTRSRSSFSLYDFSDELVVGFLFTFDTVSGEFNISDLRGVGDSSFLTTINGFDASEFYDFDVSIDYDSYTYTFTISDSSGQLYSVTNPLYNFGNYVNEGFGQIVFNEYLGSNIVMYVDYVTVDYNVIDSLPTFVSFGIVNSGVKNTKSVLYPIPSYGFGDYESTVYGSDSDFGNDYYDDFDVISFTYNNNTPVLSDEEINNIDTGEFFTDGDLASDLLPGLLDSVGIRTQTSRFVVGLIILIFVLIALASYDTLIALFGGAATIIVISLPAIGLWPVWSLAILVVVAAGIVAVGFRKITSGG